ncbi:MAG: hypothetical protein ACFCUG_05780 [Thiotrichales bacterium]
MNPENETAKTPVASDRPHFSHGIRSEPPLLRSILAVTAAIVALYPILLAALWLVRDFTRLSIQSPNLDPATQVADFNDFGYIGAFLASHHFAVAVLMTVIAISLLLLAAYLMQNWLSARPVYWIGGLSLVLVMLAQWIRFEPVNFVILAVVGVTLWLTIGWEEQERPIRPEPDVNEADAETAQSSRQFSWLIHDPILRLHTALALLAVLIAVFHL